MNGTFTLRIELGNNAMQTPTDVARALHVLAYKLDGYQLWSDAFGILIRDDNGNRVGSWMIS